MIAFAEAVLTLVVAGLILAAILWFFSWLFSLKCQVDSQDSFGASQYERLAKLEKRVDDFYKEVFSVPNKPKED